MNQEQINDTKNKIEYYTNQLEEIKHYKKTHFLSYLTANYFSTTTLKKQFSHMILIAIIPTIIAALLICQFPISIIHQKAIIIASSIIMQALLYLSFNYLQKQVHTTFQMQVAEQFFKEELTKLKQELTKQTTKSTTLQETYQDQISKEKNKHEKQQQIKPINHTYDESKPKKHIKK